MEAIPFGEFKYRYKNQPIAKLVTELDGFTGKMKLFVKRNEDGTLFALITNKKYFRAARAMRIYQKRWRIENFFNENVFLGIDRLPSLELNAIQTALTLKMVSYIEKLKARIQNGRLKKVPKIHQAIGRLKERYPIRVARYYSIDFDQTLVCEELAEKKKKAEKPDGSYVMRTDRKDMTDEEIVKTYLFLTREETAFRNMKSPLCERPIFHHLQHRA